MANVDQQIADHGGEVEHHFGARHYSKTTLLPAGCVVVQEVHKTDHVSVLLRGSVEIAVGDFCSVHTGPCAIHIKAGEHHGVKALTEAVWICIHDTQGLNLNELDSELITPSSQEDMRRIAERMLF